MLGLEYRSLRSLTPYVKNSRTHSRASLLKLRGSLAHYGWTNPMLVADNVMIAGHARLQAALEMAESGIPIPRNEDPWMGPVVDLSHLSKEDRAAYCIQDNRSALDGMWDEAILAEELGWLKESGLDLALTSFEDEELARLLGGVGPRDGVDPDDAPEPPKHPVSRLGDIWLLGNHRLACCDATDQEAVRKALNGITPHLLTTDPPYGSDYDPAWRLTKKNADGRSLTAGGQAIGTIENDDRADWLAAWKLFPGDVAYVWHSDLKSADVFRSLEKAGFEVRNQIVWAKSKLVVSRGHYHHQHECALYCVRKGKTAHWTGGTKQSTLWEIDKASKLETGHSAQKPVDCMRFPVLNNSVPGDYVYDPFVGSGTSIISCETEDRNCIACDIDPVWVDVSCKRWQNFTNRLAILESTGLTYDQMATERPIAA